MMKRVFTSVKKLTVWFTALSARERMIVGITLAFGVFFLAQSGYSIIDEKIDETKQLVQLRQNQLKDIARALNRYTALKQRRDNLQTRFAESQMTFEQVTKELDKIVRNAIGNDNYDFKKPNAPTPFGFEYEKQDFSLQLKALSLEQLVKLLHEIEQGGRPLFLSKVDITKQSAGTDFGAVLEIYSIGKSTSPKSTL